MPTHRDPDAQPASGGPSPDDADIQEEIPGSEGKSHPSTEIVNHTANVNTDTGLETKPQGTKQNDEAVKHGQEKS